jgi:hypothetical protein
VRLSDPDPIVFPRRGGHGSRSGSHRQRAGRADEAARVLRENSSREGRSSTSAETSSSSGTTPEQAMENRRAEPGERAAESTSGSFRAEDLAVVTSGIYERFFKWDPTAGATTKSSTRKNGYPVNNGLTSVTVIARDSTSADRALDLALLASASKGGLALVRGEPRRRRRGLRHGSGRRIRHERTEGRLRDNRRDLQTRVLAHRMNRGR